MKHNVHILVTVTNPTQLVASTLTLETVRVGFPNAKITIYNNGNDPIIADGLRHRSKIKQLRVEHNPVPMHHAKWIKGVIDGQKDGPIIILDPDMIFYSSCEDIPYSSLLRGYFIPAIWNEFAGCISYERFHTSFLMVQDVAKLRMRVKMFHPFVLQPSAEYCPLDPYMPAVSVVRGRKAFHDTCSTLYNIVGGVPFTEAERSRYAHINSASFYDVMSSRVEDKESFRLQHERANALDFEFFREWWKAEDRYYEEMHKKAMALLNEEEKTP
jgi:hypothetical protein